MIYRILRLQMIIQTLNVEMTGHIVCPLICANIVRIW